MALVDLPTHINYVLAQVTSFTKSCTKSCTNSLPVQFLDNIFVTCTILRQHYTFTNRHVNFVLAQTGAAKVSYIGHSQGTIQVRPAL